MKNIKQSFKEIKKTYPTIAYDIVHYIFFQLIIFIFIFSFTKISPYDQVMPNSLEINKFFQDNRILPEMTPDLEKRMDNDISLVKGFFIKLGFLVFFLIIFILLLSGIFRGLVYNKFRKKKYNKKYFKRFLFQNTIWLIFWILIFILSIKYLIPAAKKLIIPLIIIIFLHSTTIFRNLIDEKSRFKVLLKKTFEIGFMKIKYFIIPLVMSALLYILTIFIFFVLLPYLFMSIMPSSENISAMLLALLAVIMLFIVNGFVRQYYIISIKKRG